MTQTHSSAGIAQNPVLNAAFQFRQLEWDYFNPYKLESHNKIVAESKFKLPDWMTEKQDCKITICENEYSRSFKIYTAHIRLLIVTGKQIGRAHV